MVKNDQNSQEWPKIAKMIKKVNNYKKNGHEWSKIVKIVKNVHHYSAYVEL